MPLFWLAAARMLHLWLASVLLQLLLHELSSLWHPLLPVSKFLQLFRRFGMPNAAPLGLQKQLRRRFFLFNSASA